MSRISRSKLFSSNVIVRGHSHTHTLQTDGYMWTTKVVGNKDVCGVDYYFALGTGAKHCDQRVCLSVCPLANLKVHVQNLNCMRLLPEAIDQFFSDDSATSYVL